MRVEPFSFREFSNDGEVIKSIVTKKFTPNNQKEIVEETVDALPPAPPSFSEDELKQAEAESYRKGFLDGTKDGHRQAQSEQSAIDQQLTQTAEKFAEQIAPLFASYRALALELKQTMPQVALAIAKKVAASALADNAAEVVETMALHCCQTMVGEPKLTVTVHESLAQTLEGKLKDMASRQQNASQINVIGNPDMPLADCRIEWNQGDMERNTEYLWKQIEKVVADMGVSAKRDTTAQLEALKTQLPIPQDAEPAPSHDTHN